MKKIATVGKLKELILRSAEAPFELKNILDKEISIDSSIVDGNYIYNIYFMRNLNVGLNSRIKNQIEKLIHNIKEYRNEKILGSVIKHGDRVFFVYTNEGISVLIGVITFR